MIVPSRQVLYICRSQVMEFEQNLANTKEHETQSRKTLFVTTLFHEYCSLNENGITPKSRLF